MIQQLIIIAALTTNGFTLQNTPPKDTTQDQQKFIESQTLSEAQERWNAMGGCFSREIPPGDPIPDNQNAALIYAEALDLLKKCTTQDDLNMLGSPVSDEEVAEIISPIVDRCSEVIDLIVQAGAMPQCSWTSPSIDEYYEQGKAAFAGRRTLSNRDLFRLMLSDFLIAAKENDTPRMARDAKAMLQMAEPPESQHLLSFLVSVPMEGWTLSTLNNLAQTGRFPIELVHELKPILENRNWRNHYINALKLEPVNALDIWLPETKSPNKTKENATNQNNINIPEQMHEMFRMYLDLMMACVQYYNQPPHARGQLIDLYPNMPGGYMASLTLKPITRSEQVTTYIEAVIAVTLTAFDVYEHIENDEYHRIPATDDYTPTRINPYTGQPVNYNTTTTDGFAVWIEQPDNPKRLIIWQQCEYE